MKSLRIVWFPPNPDSDLLASLSMLNSPQAAPAHESSERRGHQSPAAHAQRILAAVTFHRVLDHERARSDRSGLPFALLTFEVREKSTAAKELNTTANILSQRLRTIDALGWMPGGQLGALLPYSSAEDAWRLADDVVAAHPLAGSPPACEVFVYPSSWPAPEFPSENPGDRQPRQIEPIFALPLPWWKRWLDILGASLGLILLAPLLLTVAAAVKLTSRGPVFFMQWRTGLGGRRFRMLKFRTMVFNAEALRHQLYEKNEQDGPAFKVTADPRVTPLGRLLRRKSIDELPQLWNVLKGEMTLVGPRPLPCAEAEACEVWQRRRHDVTPGLTCLWQSQGCSRDSFADWMRLDLRYIRQRSPWTDVKILLRTVPTVLFNRADH